jgi:hypothetical protein
MTITTTAIGNHLLSLNTYVNRSKFTVWGDKVFQWSMLTRQHWGLSLSGWKEKRWQYHEILMASRETPNLTQTV